MPVLEKIIDKVPVAGIQKLTTIDFPDHIAAVLFTSGCPWKCRYCHNPELRSYCNNSHISWNSLENFLKSRKGYLDGIVISGGEPTVHSSLPEFLKRIREIGYKTAIHTNGFYPHILQMIIEKGLVDYIAMDIKGPPRAYDRITQCSGTCFPVSKSITMIISSGITYEFRTTYHPAVLSEEELIEVMKAISCAGCKRYFLQQFQKEGVRDEELVKNYEIYSLPESAVKLGKDLFPEFGIR